jgi:putative membrane protein
MYEKRCFPCRVGEWKCKTASESCHTTWCVSVNSLDHAAINCLPLRSKKVSDHLANERTFLDWVRTGIAVMAFGFVIERFGLLLRELGLKVGLSSNSSILSSKLLGILVAVLGMIMLIAALFHFVQERRTIKEERYQPGLLFPLVLTCIASLIGLLLASISPSRHRLGQHMRRGPGADRRKTFATKETSRIDEATDDAGMRTNTVTFVRIPEVVTASTM